mmetsp:Transcript_50930/g.131320  ORF Transcript_50930/g.131320 Transcript_50930/m.131320 type:complete len:234 (+) Transcript_50930:975-1676(+)
MASELSLGGAIMVTWETSESSEWTIMCILGGSFVMMFVTRTLFMLSRKIILGRTCSFFDSSFLPRSQHVLPCPLMMPPPSIPMSVRTWLRRRPAESRLSTLPDCGCGYTHFSLLNKICAPRSTRMSVWLPVNCNAFVRKFPLEGKSTMPPPFSAAASKAFWMASVSMVLPSPSAPKSTTLNSFLPTLIVTRLPLNSTYSSDVNSRPAPRGGLSSSLGSSASSSSKSSSSSCSS